VAVAQLLIVRPRDTTMETSDYFGFGVALAFGIWFLMFPRSVISFYIWFHRGSVKLPGTFGVRLSGILWIALVTTVLITFLMRR
jgi:hypothetical protein